jgi:hypothetical protein
MYFLDDSSRQVNVSDLLRAQQAGHAESRRIEENSLHQQQSYHNNITSNGVQNFDEDDESLSVEVPRLILPMLSVIILLR